MTSGATIRPKAYNAITVHGMSEGETPPKLLHGSVPDYPISMLRLHKAGKCVIAYSVGADGKTKDIEVLETSDPRLAAHTAGAISDWVFTPGTQDGKPVEMRLQQFFGFNP